MRPVPAPARTDRFVPVFWLFSVGLVTILGQVVLLRELLVAFFGSELIVLLALGFLFPGTALGVFAGARLRGDASRHVRGLLLAFAVFLPVSVVFVRVLRTLFGATPGGYLPFLLQIAGMAAAMAPFGVLSGLLFQRAASLYVGGGRTLALAYAVESAGGLAGGALVTLGLALGVQNLAAGLACAFYAAAAAALAGGGKRPGRFAAASGLACVLLAAALAGSGRLDRSLTTLNHPYLAATRDTPYGRVTLTRLEGQVSVFENDALVFESQDADTEAFVHMAALQSAAPRRVLVLGGGPSGMVREVLKHAPQEVRDVELDAGSVRLMEANLPESFGRALRAKNVRLEFGDPRRYLEAARGFDLILVGMPGPESGQANRFYTREFFAACARALAPGGILGFRLGASENLWTPLLARRTASVTRALRGEFDDVLVLPGPVSVVLASRAQLVRDPAVLSERLIGRGIRARLVTPPFIRYVLTNDRLAEIEAKLGAAGAPPNTDSRPICYQYTLVLWLSRFFPALGTMDFSSFEAGAPRPWLAAAGVLLLAVLAGARLWRNARRAALAALAGFSGMLLEGVLILGFQARSGALYQDIGVLLAVFMAGLSAGALALDAWSRRNRPGGVGAGTGLCLVAGATALGFLTAWLPGAGMWPGLAGASLLMAACGFFVGGLFAYASLRRVEDQEAAIAPLYAADLLGGCAGSLLGSLFLLPVLGLPASAAVAAAVFGAGLLLV